MAQSETDVEGSDYDIFKQFQESSNIRDFDQILSDLHDLELQLTFEAADHVIIQTNNNISSTTNKWWTSRDDISACNSNSGIVCPMLNEELKVKPDKKENSPRKITMTTTRMMSEKMANRSTGSCDDLMVSSNSSSCGASYKSNRSNMAKHEVVKIYTDGGGSRNVSMTTVTTSRDVLKQLSLDIRCSALVEVIPSLFMECHLEDDDKLMEVLGMWSFDSDNCLMIKENNYKYDMFINPHKYFSKTSNQTRPPCKKDKLDLIQEYVRSNFTSPDCDGILSMKMDGRKTWKKHYFHLRPSGLYYCPKGKGKSLMDLVFLQQLYNVNVYTGINWKKKLKSPTEFCFALKHPKVQRKVPRFIKYFCAEDEATKQLWINVIRLAKFGCKIHENYEVTNNNSEPEIDFKMNDDNKYFIVKKCSHQTSFDKSESESFFDKKTLNHQKFDVQHQTIKRTFSSGSRSIKNVSSLSASSSSSCPQSPRVDVGSLCVNSSERDLNKLKPGFVQEPLHQFKCQASRTNGIEDKFTNGELGKFAILAGSFKERLLSSNKGGTTHLVVGGQSGVETTTDNNNVRKTTTDNNNVRKTAIREDFDCLPPPTDLLCGFVN